MLVLVTGTHNGFDRFRHRVAIDPQQLSSTFTVALPDLSRLAGSPTAIVLRAAGANAQADVTVTVDAQRVAVFSVAPNRSQRFDASFGAPAGAGHQLTLTSTSAPWRLEYLEISNAHGFSRGLLSFVVVPSAHRSEVPLPGWLLIPVLAALVVTRPRWGWPAGRTVNSVSRGASALVLTLFAVVLIAGVFTPYKVLLSVWTWIAGVLVLYAHPLVRLWHLLPSRVQLETWLPYAALAALFLVSVGRVYERGPGFTAFIDFGEVFEARALPVLREVPHAVHPAYGYDGQFYAQLALDPLLRGESIMAAIDNPSYRARRILMPWTAALLGAGDPWRILQAYALLNVACWLVLGWLLLHWLPAGSVRRTLAWAACMFSAGLLFSVWWALPDGASMLLIATGIRAAEVHRSRVAAAVFAVAGLARETNLLGGVVLLRKYDETWPTLQRWALTGLAVATPLALWCGYLWTIGLPPNDTGTGAFNWPLFGYVEEWVATLRHMSVDGWASAARFSLLSQVALTTRACWLLTHRQWSNPWWRTGAVYLALASVLGTAGWEGEPGAIARVGLPLTFAFNVLLPSDRYFWPLWVAGNADLLYGLFLLNLPYGLNVF